MRNSVIQIDKIFFFNSVYILKWNFPGGVAQVVKNMPANAGYVRNENSIPGSGRFPGEGNGTPVFLPGESHGQKRLVGYSTWSPKESTEAT